MRGRSALSTPPRKRPVRRYLGTYLTYLRIEIVVNKVTLVHVIREMRYDYG